VAKVGVTISGATPANMSVSISLDDDRRARPPVALPKTESHRRGNWAVPVTT
jgi:hypothetical protein